MIEFKLIKLQKYDVINLYQIELFRNKIKLGLIKFSLNMNVKEAKILNLEINHSYSYSNYGLKLLKNMEYILEKNYNIKKSIIENNKLNNKLIEILIKSKYNNNSKYMSKIF